MSLTVQQYLATATEKAANDLLTAYKRLPEDKRTWAPAESARSAANQVAECALINAGLAMMLETHSFGSEAMGKFNEGMAAMMADTSLIEPALQENTATVVAKIRELPDAALETIINMPWGPRSIAELIALPYWNMSYHEGQINYISSIIGSP